jgi:hypothetical protein
MFFVALHFRKLKNKKLIIQGFEKAKWLKIGCKCQTREKYIRFLILKDR